MVLHRLADRSAQSRGPDEATAGRRRFPLSLALLNELASWRDKAPYDRPSDFIFPTARGRQRDRANVRNRVLHPRAARANTLLEQRGFGDLPDGLSTHAGRRTAVTMLGLAGYPPNLVMRWIGHTSARLTMEVYDQVQELIRTDERIVELMRHPTDAELAAIRKAQLLRPVGGRAKRSDTTHRGEGGAESRRHSA